jgi:hypothetical protein
MRTKYLNARKSLDAEIITRQLKVYFTGNWW